MRGLRRNFPSDDRVRTRVNSTTLFVDNLPPDIRKIWVYNLFQRFGKITDCYIPNKRSKISRNSFGFVRFAIKEDAFTAISKTNGFWFWNQKLVVNIARFQAKSDVLQGRVSNGHRVNGHQLPFNRQRPIADKRGKEVWRRKGIPESSKQGEASNSKPVEEAKQKIVVQSVGNGWLLKSAVGKMRRIIAVEDLQEKISKKIKDVIIKSMGGRFIILTFSDEMVREIAMKEKWFDEWLEDVSPWNGDAARDERFVWLACFGMPLNAWQFSTFKEIGNRWGHFIQIHDDTLKENSYDKGKILIATEDQSKIEGVIDLLVEGIHFEVRIQEEESFRSIKPTKNLFTIDSLLLDEEDEDDGDRRFDDKDSVSNGQVEINIQLENIGNEGAEIFRGNKEQHSEDLLLEVIADNRLLLENVQLLHTQVPKSTNFLFPEVVEAINVVVSNSELGLDSLVEDSHGPIFTARQNQQHLENESSTNGAQESEAQGSQEAELVVPDSVEEDISPPIFGPIIFGSRNSLRASQVQSINLQMDLRPKEARKLLRSQASVEQKLNGANKHMAEPKVLTTRQKRARLRKEIRDICESLDIGTQVGEVWEEDGENSASIDSEDILRRNKIIIKDFVDPVKELQSQTAMGLRLGIEFTKEDTMVMSKMIEVDANRYALLRRSKSNC